MSDTSSVPTAPSQPMNVAFYPTYWLERHNH
jgi:hypothetical protein